MFVSLRDVIDLRVVNEAELPKRETGRVRELIPLRSDRWEFPDESLLLPLLTHEETEAGGEIREPEACEIEEPRRGDDESVDVRIRFDCVTNRRHPVDVVSDSAGIEDEGDVSLFDLSARSERRLVSRYERLHPMSLSRSGLVGELLTLAVGGVFVGRFRQKFRILIPHLPRVCLA